MILQILLFFSIILLTNAQSKSREALNYTTVDTVSTVRKEVRNLTSSELTAYFNAVITYKNVGRQDGLTYFQTYDDLVAQHAAASSNSTQDQAHEYAAFLIWHAVYIREFEIALQSIDPSVAVPYWDWTQDTDTGADSVIFTSEYFGSSGAEDVNYAVIDSPIAYWLVPDNPLDYVSFESPAGYLRSPSNPNPSPYITRFIGDGGEPDGLPTTEEYTECLVYTELNTFWPCVWGVAGSFVAQSNIHAGVHSYVGGSWSAGDGDMTDAWTSPNDPLWFSHHSQLERLYYTWRQQIGDSLATDTDPCGVFYGNAVTDPQPGGHNLNDAFYPPFYLGGDTPLTLAEACTYIQTTNAPYTYL